MKIVGLQAENIKMLKAVTITPKGNMVEIAGKNGQGKSSVLDAIWWALAGAKHIQAVPIRTGEKKARIRLDMGELIVERRFTESGSSLTVENAEGAQYRSPQSMLDGLLGALCFDPLAFVTKSAGEQFEMLRQAVNLDLGEIDHDIIEVYEERTAINRQAKAAHSNARSIEVEGEVPIERVDIDQLLDEMNDASQHNAMVLDQRKGVENRQSRADALKSDARDLRNRAEQLLQRANALEAEIDAMPPIPDEIDLDALREQLRTTQDTNKSAELWERRSAQEKAALDLDNKSEALSGQLEGLRNDRKAMIEAVDMPIDGLGLGDGVVTLNGIPFDQVSTAEQLKTSVALAMAANPKLRVIRIKEGSLLDEDSLAMIAAMAEAKDYQIWIECVGSSGNPGVVIQDGEIAAVNEKAA